MAPPYRPQPPPSRGFMDELFPVDPRTVIGGLYDQGARGVGKAIDTATGQPVGEDFSSPTLGREAYQMLSSPTFGGGMSPMAGAATLAVGAPVARRLAAGGRTAAVARTAAESDAAAQAARAATSSPGQAALDAMTNASRQGRTAAAASETAAPAARNLTGDLQSLRRMPAAEGAAIARSDLHLIPGGDRSPGFYLGGPPQVGSAADLQALRERVYQRLAGAQQGSTWYDRYRNDISRLTGGDPNASTWLARTEANWSPQRPPPTEFNFATKETSGPISGVETRASTDAQHQKYLEAVAANDPNLVARGNKVSEYAYQVDPARALDPSAASATGVNDFRHGQEFGYPKASGVGAAQHQFLDYETAKLVDRANQERLGGRNDWTGEQVQAALWVRQKAEDILLRDRPNLVRDRIAMGATPDEAWKDAWDNVAFPAANSTLGESFPERTLFATHESRPGRDVPNHMPRMATASPEDLRAFHDDPRSTWATAPAAPGLLEKGELPGRDAIYAGLYPEGAPGAGMRVLPSRPMTGLYQPPGGAPLEINPGTVARPIVGFDTVNGEKSLTPADRAIVQGSESFRAWLDAQNAGAATKVWPVEALKNSNAYFTPLDRPATPTGMLGLKAAGEPHGFPDVVDTSQGMLAQSYEGPQGFQPAARRAAEADLGSALPSGASLQPVKSESVYVPYAGEDKNYWTGAGLEPLDTPWQQGPGVGTGQATTKMLSDISPTPELRQAFAQNPYIPPVAGARVERDYDVGSRGMGAPWEAIQNARKMVAAGGDWPTELQKALKYGVPAATAAGVALTPTAGLPATPGQGPQYDEWWQRLQDQRFAGP